MRHPTRAITRDLSTRRAKRPGRGDDEVSSVVGMLTATDLVRAVIDLLSEGVLSKPERWRAEG